MVQPVFVSSCPRLNSPGVICHITVWLPSDRRRANMPCHWAAYEVFSHFLQTKDEEAIRQRFGSATAAVTEMHRKLWPGADVDKSFMGKKLSDNKSKHFAYAKKFGITTGYMFAMLSWAMNSAKRSDQDRQQAAQLFRNLVETLVRCLGRLQLEVPVVGRPGVWTTVTTNSTGRLPGTHVWAYETLQLCEQPWLFAVGGGFAGMKSTARNPHLADIVIFGLVPNSYNPEEISSVMLPTALCLVTQIAKLVDENAERLATHSICSDLSQMSHKNLGEQHVVTAARVCKAAMFLFHENEPQLEPVLEKLLRSRTHFSKISWT